MLDSLYIGMPAYNEEAGFYCTVLSHGIDGVVMTVYGETSQQSVEHAKKIIEACNKMYGEDPSVQSGAKRVQAFLGNTGDDYL